MDSGAGRLNNDFLAVGSEFRRQAILTSDAISASHTLTGSLYDHKDELKEVGGGMGVGGGRWVAVG